MNIWDTIAWIVLGLILLWIILKIFGIINTPDLIVYAPYLGAVYLAGWAMHKLETVVKDAEELKRFKDATVSEINYIKTNCAKYHSK